MSSRGMTRALVIVAAAASGLLAPVIGRLFAETGVTHLDVTLHGQAYHLEGSTSHTRHIQPPDDSFDGGRGSSVSFLSGNPGYITELRAHVKAWSSDPGNSSGGWEVKEQDNAARYGFYTVETAEVQVGGTFFDAPSVFTCSFPAHNGYFPCYFATRHYYVDQDHGCCPYLGQFTYSSNDNNHSHYLCWNYGGCESPGGGGGGSSGSWSKGSIFG